MILQFAPALVAALGGAFRGAAEKREREREEAERQRERERRDLTLLTALLEQPGVQVGTSAEPPSGLPLLEAGTLSLGGREVPVRISPELARGAVLERRTLELLGMPGITAAPVEAPGAPPPVEIGRGRVGQAELPLYYSPLLTAAGRELLRTTTAEREQRRAFETLNRMAPERYPQFIGGVDYGQLLEEEAREARLRERDRIRRSERAEDQAERRALRNAETRAFNMLVSARRAGLKDPVGFVSAFVGRTRPPHFGALLTRDEIEALDRDAAKVVASERRAAVARPQGARAPVSQSELSELMEALELLEEAGITDREEQRQKLRQAGFTDTELSWLP